MLSLLWQSIADNYAAYCENIRPLDLGKVGWPGWEANQLRRFKGKTCLGQAYIAASEAQTVEDHLLYAQILYAMYHENLQNGSEYERFHSFIAPGWEQVKLAVAAGQRMIAKELAFYQETYEELAYIVQQTTDSREQSEQAYALVEGLSAVPEYGFHDSKPVHFEHGNEYALLVLEFHDIRLTLEFDHPYEIQVNGDPITNWINDFYCYRSFRNSEYIIFDVGYYHIECKGVRVKSTEKIDA